MLDKQTQKLRARAVAFILPTVPNTCGSGGIFIGGAVSIFMIDRHIHDAISVFMCTCMVYWNLDSLNLAHLGFASPRYQILHTPLFFIHSTLDTRYCSLVLALKVLVCC